MSQSRISSDFASWSSFLGKKQERTVTGKRATKLTRLFSIRSATVAEGSIALTYHGTVLAVAEPGGDFLLFGGIGSHTDKDRLNEYTPARVFQRDFRWYTHADGQPFTSGMRVTSAGLPRPLPV